jgi:hypothetical protein
MRPPGGPPTRGTVLPTSTAVEENGGKQGLVEVRSSLRELTGLLEPQSDHEASARREEPPDETADEAIAQANLGLLYAQRAEGDRSQNWELAIAAFEDALSTAELGSLTKAAAELRTSQPALTRHIMRLEHELRATVRSHTYFLEINFKSLAQCFTTGNSSGLHVRIPDTPWRRCFRPDAIWSR